MTPTDIGNLALDAAGIDFTMGDIEEGTEPAKKTLRAYGKCMRDLLRAVHWDFARRQSDLQMLADATGQTPGVGTLVIAPWIYCYRYPIDCMKARFLPRNYLNPSTQVPGNITPPNAQAPLTTGTAQPPLGYGMRLIPAPFLLAFDPNYPVDPNSNWLQLQGETPAGSVVILTNVNQAQLVYTALMTYPSAWDALFRSAMIAYLASEIAMPLAKDKKFGLQMRKEQMEIARGKVAEARVANGNESGFPQTIDHLPDFMRTRFIGSSGLSSSGFGPGCGIWGSGGWGFDGVGYLGYGADSGVF